MEWLEIIGRTLGFSLAAGVNLYATVAILGLASRYGWVALPEQYQVFDNPWIIGAAGVLYAIEFVADKIPWVDSIWDSVHTFIRPVGGALIAVAALGDQAPAVLIGIARDNPLETMEFIPITSPRALTSGPPEFPGAK